MVLFTHLVKPDNLANAKVSARQQHGSTRMKAPSEEIYSRTMQGT